MLKLKKVKGLNIDRKYWEMLVTEHGRTEKSVKLIVEELIQKYLGRKTK